MTARTRAIVGLALLLLAAAHLAAGAVRPASCDDGCAPDCGSCASCPPVAGLVASPSVTPCPLGRAALPAIAARPQTSPTRAIEHVPLQLPS